MRKLQSLKTWREYKYKVEEVQNVEKVWKHTRCEVGTFGDKRKYTNLGTLEQSRLGKLTRLRKLVMGW